MCPCRRLKGAEHLCAMISVEIKEMSLREQTDPFRLPAEVAEWVILLLSRKKIHTTVERDSKESTI